MSHFFSATVCGSASGGWERRGDDGASHPHPNTPSDAPYWSVSRFSGEIKFVYAYSRIGFNLKLLSPRAIFPNRKIEAEGCRWENQPRIYELRISNEAPLTTPHRYRVSGRTQLYRDTDRKGMKQHQSSLGHWWERGLPVAVRKMDQLILWIRVYAEVVLFVWGVAYLVVWHIGGQSPVSIVPLFL